ncbi:MAG: hypothetical protein KDD64_11440 [Bdellovibrionales bacterium]|nr:hypothetical protein [Bdellovibrionales bacterium]
MGIEGMRRFFIAGVFLVLLVAVCSGCGVESIDSTQNQDVALTQTYIGQFLFEGSTPASGAEISIPLFAHTFQTDLDGLIEFELPPLAGDLELIITIPGSGRASVVLPEIDPNAETIAFEVALERADATARLSSIEFDPLKGDESSTGGDDSDPGSDSSSGDSSDSSSSSSDSGQDSGASKKEQIARGKRVFESVCADCHLPGRGDGYGSSRLRKTLQLPQHSGVKLSSSKFGDLVAFLNR